MPVYIGDVLESSGGPVLNIGTNQIAGIGVFEDVDARDNLDTDLRVVGYISIIDGNLSVYNGSTWTSDAHWEKVASDFSLYPQVPVFNGVENSAPQRASYFVGSVEDTPNRFSFGVFDSELNDFRKISGEDLRAIIIHYFGQELAFTLAETTANDIDYYTDPTTGVIGDLNGDGLVTTSDLLIFLGYYGSTDPVSNRNYEIKLGETYWQNANPLPLLGSFSENDFGYSSTSFVNGFTNNTDVDGTTAGDDISFVNSTSEKFIGIERQDPNGVSENIKSWMISGAGTVPVGSTVFPTTESDITTVARLNATMNASPGTSAFLRVRIRIKDENGLNILRPNGSAFKDINIAAFNNGGSIFAGENNAIVGDAIPDINILNVIDENWTLSNVSFVKQITLSPYVYVDSDQPSQVNQFEIENLIFKVEE